MRLIQEFNGDDLLSDEIKIYKSKYTFGEDFFYFNSGENLIKLERNFNKYRYHL